jgi:hypothetical protein
MRYFFHIVDKYGLSPDQTGYEHADKDSAVLHAKHIAAELAKAGEFFNSSIVLVAGCHSETISGHDHGAAAAFRDGPAANQYADFLPLLSTENP